MTTRKKSIRIRQRRQNRILHTCSRWRLADSASRKRSARSFRPWRADSVILILAQSMTNWSHRRRPNSESLNSTQNFFSISESHPLSFLRRVDESEFSVSTRFRGISRRPRPNLNRLFLPIRLDPESCCVNILARILFLFRKHFGDQKMTKFMNKFDLQIFATEKQSL